MQKYENFNNKGFSLMELIIVIAIMAILIGVLAPNLIRYVEKTKVAADYQLCNSVRMAVMLALADPTVPQSQKAIYIAKHSGRKLDPHSDSGTEYGIGYGTSGKNDTRAFFAVMNEILGIEATTGTGMTAELNSRIQSAHWVDYDGEILSYVIVEVTSDHQVTVMISNTDSTAHGQFVNANDPDSLGKYPNIIVPVVP